MRTSPPPRSTRGSTSSTWPRPMTRPIRAREKLRRRARGFGKIGAHLSGAGGPRLLPVHAAGARDGREPHAFLEHARERGIGVLVEVEKSRQRVIAGRHDVGISRIALTDARMTKTFAQQQATMMRQGKLTAGITTVLNVLFNQLIQGLQRTRAQGSAVQGSLGKGVSHDESSF